MLNDTLIRCLIAGCIAYMLGNINPSILIAKLYHVDIRKEGSGNPGTTNTIRVIGLKAGIAVLALDVLKAFVAVKIGAAIGGTAGAMAGFACVVLGHCFPALYGFKGGKGVAASLGAALALNYQSALCALLVAAVMFAVFRRMSVGSLSAGISYPFLIRNFMPECFYFAIGCAVFLIIMHIPNIIRLVKGEEKALTLGHRNKKPSDDPPEEPDEEIKQE